MSDWQFFILMMGFLLNAFISDRQTNRNRQQAESNKKEIMDKINDLLIEIKKVKNKSAIIYDRLYDTSEEIEVIKDISEQIEKHFGFDQESEKQSKS